MTFSIVDEEEKKVGDRLGIRGEARESAVLLTEFHYKIAIRNDL